MKYILLPIHPEWVCLFLNGIKKIEVRSGTRLYNAINRLIDEQGCAPCLAYCTKGKPYLYQGKWFGSYFVENDKKAYGSDYLNGKVIAEFEASAEKTFFVDGCFYETDTLSANTLLARSCLGSKSLHRYLGEKDGTAIHVEQGTMRTDGFPKDLSDYGIKRAPQSFMYVEVVE